MLWVGQSKLMDLLEKYFCKAMMLTTSLIKGSQQAKYDATTEILTCVWGATV